MPPPCSPPTCASRAGPRRTGSASCASGSRAPRRTGSPRGRAGASSSSTRTGRSSSSCTRRRGRLDPACPPWARRSRSTDARSRCGRGSPSALAAAGEGSPRELGPGHAPRRPRRGHGALRGARPPRRRPHGAGAAARRHRARDDRRGRHRVVAAAAARAPGADARRWCAVRSTPCARTAALSPWASSIDEGLWTSFVARRREGAFDVIAGPDELRPALGLLSGDWRRDYRHLARAVEDRYAPLGLGCFAEVTRFRALQTDARPGAWRGRSRCATWSLAPMPGGRRRRPRGRRSALRVRGASPAHGPHRAAGGHRSAAGRGARACGEGHGQGRRRAPRVRPAGGAPCAPGALTRRTLGESRVALPAPRG